METSVTNLDDVSLDGFDDAPISTEPRKPNSIEQIENIKRMISNLQAEQRRLEKRVPLDSIPVLKDMLVKRLGRMPVKGDYIMGNTQKAFHTGPLVQVVDPKVDFHEEPYEPEDDEEMDEDDRFWGMTAHILVTPFNAKGIRIHNADYTNEFGLEHLQAKKKSFRLMSQAEVDAMPRVITARWTTGPIAYTNHPTKSNTQTTIKMYCANVVEAIKAYDSLIVELKKELKLQKKWKGKKIMCKANTDYYKPVEHKLECYESDKDVGENWRRTQSMGQIHMEFYLGKKFPKKTRQVQTQLVY